MKAQIEFSLKGKSVYVLGGLGFIGIAVSKALALSGANVVVLDLDSKRSTHLLAWAKRANMHIAVEVFDASELDGAEKALRRLVRRHGKMHAWVNVSYPRSRDWALKLEDMTVNYLRDNIEKHLNSYLWTARLAATLMKESGVRGSIVNFGSIYGITANDNTIYEGTTMHGEMLYCAMKAGIINATRFLAAHFGPDGIRANSLCPGGIFHNQDPIFVRRYEKRTPLRRMGTPEDIGWPVVFLCSDASAYITGQILMVDGGWTAV